VSFFRKGILVSGGQMTSVFLNMLAGVIFSRALGPDGMGQYELFRNTAILAATICAMGLGSANIFFLNNRKVEPVRIVTNAFKVSLTMGALLAAGLTAAFLGFPRYFGHISPVAAAWFAVGAASLLSISILRPILVARLQARRMVAVDISARLTLLVAAGALALPALFTSGYEMQPQLALGARALGNFVGYVLLLSFLRSEIHPRRPIEWKLLLNVLVYGVKLAAANIMYLLSSSVTVMLLRYFRQEDFGDVGFYTRAVAVAGMVSMIPTSLGPLLYAKFASGTGEARARQAERALRMNVCLGVIMTAGVLLFGKYVIWVLYGREFLPGSDAFVFLAPALFFIPVFGVAGNLLSGDGKALITAALLGGTLVVVATVACLTIPTMSFRGAALATLCGNAFTASATFIVASRFYGLRLAHSVLLNREDIRYVISSIRGSR
jgi:O-antigen/teichoic acid export membrane protein